MFNFLTPYLSVIKLAMYVVAFAVGGFAMHHFDQKKIDGLNQKLGSYEVTIRSMTALVTEQNAGIDKLVEEAKQRKIQADHAITDALEQAADANKKAQKILMSKPPKGKNQCTAAQEAFAEELKAERSGK